MNEEVRTKITDSGSQAASDSGFSERIWDHSTDNRFYDYYATESQSAASAGRFSRVRDVILRILGQHAHAPAVLDVADIGCGAGSQSLVWAELGHRVHALDVNEPLISLGRTRAAECGVDIDFRVGSATALPWPDESMDVCVALELIEHVDDWRQCVNEFVRVLRPGGVLFLTTTNRLCPIQEEFNLPLYSWYPARLKRHFEKLAVTTRPAIANYARYPAVNWFTFYGLRRVLKPQAFRCLDRFDLMDVSSMGRGASLIVATVRSTPILRFFAQLCSPGTRILAIKEAAGTVRNRFPSSRSARMQQRGGARGRTKWI